MKINSVRFLSTAGIAGGLALSGAVRAQTGDIIARQVLILKGHIDADVQLLEEGELTIGPDAKVRGDAFVLEDKSAGQPGLAAGRPSAGVRFTNSKGGESLNGTLKGTASFELPAVANRKVRAGNRVTVVQGSDKPPADFERVGDLTVKYAFASVEIPPGVYGRFSVQGARVVLGHAGAIVPDRYDFESLTVSEQGRVELAGPVIITVGSVGTLNGVIGRPDLPGWLDLRVASGVAILGAGSAIHGAVCAPGSVLTLAEGAAMEGWIAANAVTVERNARFKAVRPDWYTSGRAQAPVFTQKMIRMQNRLSSFSERQTAKYGVTLAYKDDIPTLTLVERPQRKGDKLEPEDRKIFFDAFCLLLANTGVERARVVMQHNAVGKNPANVIDVEMGRSDFESHLWALGHNAIAAENVRMIGGSPALMSGFLLRSQQVANANWLTNR